MDIENTNNIAPPTDAEVLATLGQEEHQQYAGTDEMRNAQGRIIRGRDGADDGLTVQFSTEAFYNKLLTFRAGGVPKYSDQDMITITTPGDIKPLSTRL
jgi:hypothetical protein